jgi:hypothetical protein
MVRAIISPRVLDRRERDTIHAQTTKIKMTVLTKNAAPQGTKRGRRGDKETGRYASGCLTR